MIVKIPVLVRTTALLLFLIGAIWPLAKASARPEFARTEGVPCAYCHFDPRGGGALNYRGVYYRLHDFAFTGFDDAIEARKAGSPVAPAADHTPASRTAPVGDGSSLVLPFTTPGAWRLTPAATTATANVVGDELKVVVPGRPEKDLQLAFEFPNPPPDGATLSVHFRARADVPYPLHLTAQRDALAENDGADIGFHTNVFVGTDSSDYTFPWVVRSPHPAANRFSFVFSAPYGANPGSVTLYLSDIYVSLDPGAAQPPTPPVDLRDVAPFGRWLDPVSGIWFVKIPAGSYMRGTADAQRDALRKLGLWSARDSDEMPARTINISHPFLISEKDVTQAEWRRVMVAAQAEPLASPSAFPGDARPVDSVSFDDATGLCHALSTLASARQSVSVYRLPTEAEWEYAARAGSDGPLPLGQDNVPMDTGNLGQYCWMIGTAPNATGTAGAKLPNAWGLYDMLGNVWQWCEDEYSAGAYATLPTTDPLFVSPNAKEHVLRGGCWSLGAGSLRPAARSANVTTFRNPNVGVRIVREL
jgi:formylglycine-generating enzyme required for sulfatase activity